MRHDARPLWVVRTQAMEHSANSSTEDPAHTVQRLRKRVLAGAHLLVMSLSADEMAAANELILRGEAERVSSACRPCLVVRLDQDFAAGPGQLV